MPDQLALAVTTIGTLADLLGPGWTLRRPLGHHIDVRPDPSPPLDRWGQPVLTEVHRHGHGWRVRTMLHTTGASLPAWRQVDVDDLIAAAETIRGHWSDTATSPQRGEGS